MNRTIVMLVVAGMAGMNLLAAENASAGKSLWYGRKVAFLGDSITDRRHIGCTSNYWNFLERDLGIVPLVYGINGQQMNGLLGQAMKLKNEHPDGVEDIFVFAGTNDYNANVPLGEWFAEAREKVLRNGREVELKRRDFIFDDGTFRGRVNRLMKYLRENFPSARFYLLPPIHRGYATFGPKNVQPAECYANELGLFIDAYVNVVKEAGNVWAAMVIDINAHSGLFPIYSSASRYFHNAKTDMLHPNAAGHERIAAAIIRELP